MTQHGFGPEIGRDERPWGRKDAWGRKDDSVDFDRCHYCDELLSLAETEPDALDRLLYSDEMGSDLVTGQRCHRVCLFRGVSGSVAHIEGRCGCVVPGSSDGDDPGLTKLQAAEAALAAFRRRGSMLEVNRP